MKLGFKRAATPERADNSIDFGFTELVRLKYESTIEITEFASSLVVPLNDIIRDG